MLPLKYAISKMRSCADWKLLLDFVVGSSRGVLLFRIRSMLPFKLGPDLNVKFSVLPCDPDEPSGCQEWKLDVPGEPLHDPQFIGALNAAYDLGGPTSYPEEAPVSAFQFA